MSPDMKRVFAFAAVPVEQGAIAPSRCRALGARVQPNGLGRRVIALDAARDVLDEVTLPALTPVDEWVSTWSPKR